MKIKVMLSLQHISYPHIHVQKFLDENECWSKKFRGYRIFLILSFMELWGGGAEEEFLSVSPWTPLKTSRYFKTTVSVVYIQTKYPFLNSRLHLNATKPV
jgi:hypothetical protein